MVPYYLIATLQKDIAANQLSKSFELNMEAIILVIVSGFFSLAGIWYQNYSNRKSNIFFYKLRQLHTDCRLFTERHNSTKTICYQKCECYSNDLTYTVRLISLCIIYLYY